MNKFDIKRFFVLMQWSLVSERGFLIKTMVILTLAFTAFMLIINIGFEKALGAGVFSETSDIGSVVADKMSASFIIIYLMLSWVVMMVGGCMMFRNVSDKQKRISFLVLPASNAEKFLSRLVLVLGGGILMLAVSFVVSDLLRILFVRLLFGESHIGFLLSEFLKHGYNVFTLRSGNVSDTVLFLNFYAKTLCGAMPYGPWLAVIFVVVEFMFTFSIFMFFGVLLRKYALLAAFLFNMLSNVLFVNIDSDTFMTIVKCVIIVVLCFASYNIFTHMQVINNKITNI